MTTTTRITIELTDSEYAALVSTLENAAARFATAGYVLTADKLRTMAVKVRLAAVNSEIARIMATPRALPSLLTRQAE